MVAIAGGGGGGGNFSIEQYSASLDPGGPPLNLGGGAC